jgi:hypothetical protein
LSHLVAMARSSLGPKLLARWLRPMWERSWLQPSYSAPPNLAPMGMALQLLALLSVDGRLASRRRELGESSLDGIEVGDIRGKLEQPRSPSLDGFSYSSELSSRSVAIENASFVAHPRTEPYVQLSRIPLPHQVCDDKCVPYAFVTIVNAPSFPSSLSIGRRHDVAPVTLKSGSESTLQLNLQ